MVLSARNVTTLYSFTILQVELLQSQLAASEARAASEASRAAAELQAAESRHTAEVSRLTVELRVLREAQSAEVAQERRAHQDTAAMLKEVSNQVSKAPQTALFFVFPSC